MSRRWNLALESLRLVHRGHIRTLVSGALCNRRICTISENLPSSSHTVVDESYVLAELSSLLPIESAHSKTTTATEDTCSRNQVTAVDSILSPEERLRGVFLQKLKGKSAIHKALSSLGIELSIDIVANVVDSGNLSGESMVTFFNWAIREPGVSKDVDDDSYYVILRALGRRKFFSFMMDVLREMVSPDLKCLTIAMDSFARAHYVRRAIQLFEESEEFGVECGTESLNALLGCLCERSHVSASNSVFNAKRGEIRFDGCTYNVMIGGWSKLGEVGEMEKVFKEMVEGGFGPDCLSFSYLIEGLGRAGRVNDSVEIFDGMKDKGCVPDAKVYNAMICNFLFAQDFDEAMRYYRRMLDEECEPDLETYSKLVLGLIKGRKVADALEIYEEMLSRGIVPTTGLVTSFIKPLCSYGPPHAAMVIYQKGRKAGCRISESAYKLLLKRLSRFGKCGILLNVWDEMQECGYSSDVEVYEYIVDGLCNIGHLENAVLVMEEAMRKGFCPNRLVYSRLSNKLMASKKTEMAYKLFLKIKEARIKDNARRFWRRNGWHF